MTPINKLTSVTPTLSDRMALWDSTNSVPRGTSLSMLLELFEANSTVGKPYTQYAAPSAAGFSIDVLNNGGDVHLILIPLVTLLSDGTIVLPSSVRDKQTFLMNTTKQIVDLTISSTKSVIGAPASLAADDFFTLKYDLTTDAWYRVG
jgi:hypothetical protein